MSLMSIFWLVKSLWVYETCHIRNTNFSNRTGLWSALESGEDHNNVCVAVGEGNWSHICMVLALPVVLWLVCDFTDVSTN